MSVKSGSAKERCQNGYKCIFNDSEAHIKDYKCFSCDRVSRLLSLTTCCGEQFCKAYLVQIISDGQCCPKCGDKRFSYAPNRKEQKNISNLSVFCATREQGCNWEGTVLGLDDHKKDCEHTYVPCPSGCGQLRIKKGRLEEHLKSECPQREYSCPHCDYRGTHKTVTSVHYANCSYYPVDCPNWCGVKGERDDMETHLQHHCPLQNIKCKFSHAGCNKIFRRKDEPKHMEECTRDHVDSLASLTEKMQSEIKDFAARYSRHEETHRQMGNKIAELKRNLEQEEENVILLEKQVSNMTNNVGEEISPPEHQVENERRDFYRKLETKIDEKEMEIQKLEKKSEDLQAKLDELNKKFETRLSSMEKVLNCRQTRSDSNVACASNPVSHPLVEFTVDNYTSLKSRKEKWTSPTFTTEHGHKLKFTVWPDGQGDGRGEYVSVWLERDLDDIAEMENFHLIPAEIIVTLKLINQLCGDPEDQTHITVTRTFTIPEVVRYLGDVSNTFVAHSKLESTFITQYLMEDSLKFKVTHIQVTPMT